MILQFFLLFSTFIALPTWKELGESAISGLKRKASALSKDGIQKTALKVATNRNLIPKNSVQAPHLNLPKFKHFSPELATFLFGKSQKPTKVQLSIAKRRIEHLKGLYMENLNFFKDIRDFEMKISPRLRIYNNDVHHEIKKAEDLISVVEKMLDEIKSISFRRELA